MEKDTVTFPELLRIAANCAEVCIGDKNCIVKFDGRGIESIGDDRFIVNLPGAVLVRVFSHPTNKSYETLTGPPWQTSLHAMSSGNVSRALEYAFGTARESAPPEIVSKLASAYRRIGSGTRSTKQKIAWVNQVANALEGASEWISASETLDFQRGNSTVRPKGRTLTHPFLEACQKIEALLGEEGVLKTNVGWGDIDFFDVWQVLDRILQMTRQLGEVTSNDVSALETNRTINVLESILSTLEEMKDWNLSRENAASERLRYMSEVEHFERDLIQALQGWFPMWSSLRLETQKTEALETERRAKHAQAEASGAATSEIAVDYTEQGKRAKRSRYCWTLLSLAAAASILLIAFGLMDGGSDEQVPVWSVQRLDSIITRFLSASVFGGVAYWAGRIATMRLREEGEHLHKALIARTLKGMKEGADTEETRAQIDLAGHLSLLQVGDQEKISRVGPITGNAGAHLSSVIQKSIDSE